VAVPAIIAAGAVAAHAVTDVSLPAKTPQQVVELVGSSTVSAFSGTFTQSSDLGLPELPTTGPSADAGVASALDLVTGSHTARVYVDGATKQRVQVLDSLAERDVVRNGSDVWLYDSAKATATHIVLPARSADHTPSIPQETQTPAELAHELLANIGPSTDVTLGANTNVAGRSAYDLVLTPKATQTLIGSVSVAVDSETGLPLSVDVQARGQKNPAVSVAFTDVSLMAPDASLFDFTPPAGTKVTQQAAPAVRDKTDGKSADGDSAHKRGTVSGSDWTTIVELPAGSVPASVSDSPLYSQATTAVSGGRVLSTSLVSVLLTDDGRVFAGAVPASALQSAAEH
jgi:outer membrane lipoprotein-sorting protein